MFLHADSEDSDQTGRMPRLIWVFAGHTGHFVGFVMWRLKWFRSEYEMCQCGKIMLTNHSLLSNLLLCITCTYVDGAWNLLSVTHYH